MRLFATGAMDFVMKKALPDDAPLATSLYLKSREHRIQLSSAMQRSSVLKYDELMNEQRKVIYARRNEILKGKTLKDTIDCFAAAIDEALNSIAQQSIKTIGI